VTLAPSRWLRGSGTIALLINSNSSLVRSIDRTVAPARRRQACSSRSSERHIQSAQRDPNGGEASDNQEVRGGAPYEDAAVASEIVLPVILNHDRTERREFEGYEQKAACLPGESGEPPQQHRDNRERREPRDESDETIPSRLTTLHVHTLIVGCARRRVERPVAPDRALWIGTSRARALGHGPSTNQSK
ncbi:MAG TPA: hypothetical protein VMH41_12270, partial [Mycobacteriales bacterium]|nr:hypothetical protein [Mycobacteriales bacterium]